MEKISSFDEYLGSDLFCLINIFTEFYDDKFYFVVRIIKKNIEQWRDYNNLYTEEIDFYIKLAIENRHRFSNTENIKHIKSAVNLTHDYKDGFLYFKSLLIHSKISNNKEEFERAKKEILKYGNKFYIDLSKEIE